jgi:hypothetical protein
VAYDTSRRNLFGTRHLALRASSIGKESVLFLSPFSLFSFFSSLRQRGLAVLLFAVVAVACNQSAGSRKPEAGAVDDFGDTLRLAHTARRIVSLNPVTTEILFALGAGNRVVGRTHWDL